jgi:hypothetical protein
LIAFFAQNQMPSGVKMFQRYKAELATDPSNRTTEIPLISSIVSTSEQTPGQRFLSSFFRSAPESRFGCSFGAGCAFGADGEGGGVLKLVERSAAR